MNRIEFVMLVCAVAVSGCMADDDALSARHQEELVGPLPCGTLLRFSVDGDQRDGSSTVGGDLLEVARSATEFAVVVDVLEQVRALGCTGCAKGQQGCEPTVDLDHPDNDLAGAHLTDLRTSCTWNGGNWFCHGTVDFNRASGRTPVMMAGCSPCVDCVRDAPTRRVVPDDQDLEPCEWGAGTDTGTCDPP